MNPLDCLVSPALYLGSTSTQYYTAPPGEIDLTAGEKQKLEMGRARLGQAGPITLWEMIYWSLGQQAWLKYDEMSVMILGKITVSVGSNNIFG